MPVAQVALTRGRSPETIRSMISAVTRARVDSDVAPKENVRVQITELPPGHLAAGDVTIAERRTAQESAATTPTQETHA